jgi:hypothetical protein
MAIEINGQRGGFEDIADFTRRVWTAGYGGKMWFSIWDAAFRASHLGGTGARYLSLLTAGGTPWARCLLRTGR